MYRSGLSYHRTPQERADRFLSRNRSDKAFFASGACHILAYLFLELHPGEGFELIQIRPAENYPGTHMYASNGIWAFDFNGWTREKEIIHITQKEYASTYPGWEFERVVITNSLEDFCKKNNHRMPYQYAHLPWERAYAYIKKFPSLPPKK